MLVGLTAIIMSIRQYSKCMVDPAVSVPSTIYSFGTFPTAAIRVSAVLKCVAVPG